MRDSVDTCVRAIDNSGVYIVYLWNYLLLGIKSQFYIYRTETSRYFVTMVSFCVRVEVTCVLAQRRYLNNISCGRIRC